MITRNFVLAGVASLALAGAFFAATPGFAQDFETVETDRLNTDQATLPPAPSPEDKAAYEAALAQHSQAQTQYDAQLQDYQARQRAYSDAKQNYDTRTEAYAAQSNIYQDEAAHYDADRGAFDGTVVIDGPDRFGYPDGHTRLWELGVLENPDREIGGVPVEDRAGHVVGHFRRMTFRDDNIPKAVITLNNNKTIILDEDHFRYDPDDIVVVADMDFDELNSMPARF
jgi:hypothetical protein